MKNLDRLSTQEIAAQIRISKPEEWRTLWHSLRERKDAEPFIVELLQDENLELRVSLIEMVTNPVSEAIINTLISGIKSENDDVRKASAERLGVFKSELAVEPLITMTKDSNALVQNQAIVALENIKDRRATKALCECLNSSDKSIRLRAIMALYKMRDQTCIDAIIDALKDSLASIRVYTVKTLGEIGDRGVLEPLVAMLYDKDKGVRYATIEALVQLYGVDAIPYLTETLAHEEDDYVRDYLESSIEEIANSDQDVREIHRDQWLYRTWLKNPTLDAGSEIYKFYEDGTGEVKDFYMGIIRDYTIFKYQISEDRICILFDNKEQWVETKFELEAASYDHPNEGDVSCLTLVFEKEPYFTDFISGKSKYYYINGIGSHL